MKKPFKLTANMVTVARIVLLPVPCAFLLYGGQTAWWIAFFLLTFLGMTDFVDGAMARRDGPTKLGSLIDTLADKIFIAAITLTYASIGFFPVWAAVAILWRELLLTGLRSSVGVRNEQLKTSTLGKMKTIIQMGGAGTIFLTHILSQAWLIAVSLLLAISIGSVAVVYVVRKKKVPFWVVPVSLCFVLVAVLAVLVSPETSIWVQMLIVVALTWISGADYLVGAYRIIRRSGIKKHDIERIAWSCSFAFLVIPIVVLEPSALLPILISISSELALGGVDTVVASQEQKYIGWPFLATTAAALLFFVLFVTSSWTVPTWISGIVLSLVSLTVFAVTFIKWRYLFKNVLD